MPAVSEKPAGISWTHVAVGDGDCVVTGGVVSVRSLVAAIARGVAMIATAATPPIAARALLRRRIRVPRRRTSEAGSGFMVSPGVEKFSSSSRGSRMAESFLVGEQGGQRRASAAEPGLDGSFGYADLAGDVVHGQVGDVVEHQRLPLGLGQLLERRHQGDVRLAGGRALVRRAHG